MRPSQTKLAAHLALLFVIAIWGSTFTLVKAALADCTPLLFNAVRMLLAFAVLLGVNWRKLRDVKRSSLAGCALVGLLLALGYELQVLGLARTTPAKSAFLTGLVVVLVPLLGALPGIRVDANARLRWPALLGAGLAFVGIVLLTTPAGTALRGMTLSLGDMLSMLCAIAFAMHLLALGRVTRQVPAAELATLQIGFCAVAMTIAAPLLERPELHLTTRLIVAWTITAVLATALAFSVQTWAQQHLSAGNTALLLALEPAFAWLISLWLLHDRLDRRGATGALCILAGLLVSELLSGTGPVAEQPEANLGA